MLLCASYITMRFYPLFLRKSTVRGLEFNTTELLRDSIVTEISSTKRRAAVVAQLNSRNPQQIKNAVERAGC